MEQEFREELVTYNMQYEGHTVVIENVPARVDCVTGEAFFTTETVDRLGELIRAQQPVRYEQTPIFSFAA